MITCPVCETQQPPSDECVTCGKKFGGMDLSLLDPVSRLDGLEPTAVDEATATAAAESVPGLEPTRMEDAGAAAPAAPIPDLAPTIVEDPLAAMIASEAIPDLEATRAEFQRDTGAEVPANAPCVYCGHVQESGRTCDNCGRLRTRVIPAAVPEAEAAEVEIVDGLERCRSCGGRVRPAPLCSECGRPLPVSEA